MAGLKPADAEIARLIRDDIETGNYKEALRRVDKKLKKTDLDHFKALQALIKAHQGQLSEKGAILLQLEDLVLSKRVLTDFDALQFYDQALELILPKPGGSWPRIIGHLRWQLVKATPKDVDASRACFRACLTKEDYENARYIANSLEKNFPTNHEYVFWNITTMFLYSKTPGYSEKERKLYGALAEGLIRKLADATVKAASSTSLPVRSIQKPQELLLMDIILRSGDSKKMNSIRLNYLQNAFLGPDSIIAKGEWRLWITKLELLQDQPELLFQTTSDLLKRARTKDESGIIAESRFSDWVVWKAYVDSALTDKSTYKDEVEAEIRAHLDPESGVDKSWKRNASLALLRFAFAPTSAFSDREELDLSKKDLVVQYLEQHGDANMTYNDLKESVQSLNVQELEGLLTILIENKIFGGSDSDESRKGSLYPSNQVVTTVSGVMRLVNVYKLIFLITSSIPECYRSKGQETAICLRCSTILSNDYCKTCLARLARAATKSYGMAMSNDAIASKLIATDLHPADDLCILAAMCLAKLSMESVHLAGQLLESPPVSYLLQAASLLEYGWSKSKANSQIVLLLTSLYSILGCGSLAMRAYKRLGIKQIQNATLSYCMFDGIAIMHPHPFPSDNTSQQRSIIEELRGQQKIYKHSPKQISNKIWTSFEQNNYNTVFELEEVKKALAYNVSAVMSVIESRRISRLLEPKGPLTTSSFGYDILPSDVENPDTSFEDENDYNAMPNFEVLGEESPLDHLYRICRGNIPISDRAHLDLFAEKLLALVDPITDSVSMTSARLYINQNLHPVYDKWAGDQACGLDFRYAAYNDMGRIVHGISEYENSLVQRLVERLKLIQRLESPAIQLTLNSLYSSYEVATCVIKLNGYLVRTTSKGLHESLNVAEQLLKTVIEQSSSIKRSLDEGGWIDRVLKSVSQGESNAAEGVVDENFMEEWAGDVVDSWKDSVKGFAYFKAL